MDSNYKQLHVALHGLPMEEEKPVVTNVTISDVSWDSFLLSWSAEDGAFDAFLIEVTDAETGAEWQNHTVLADARSLAISGLSPTTWYRANLYGVYRGTLLDPVFADTITDLGAPKGIRFSDVTDTSATVHWAVPRARVDSYKVTYVPAHGGNAKTLTVDNSESQTVLPNLTPGVTYEVTVVAVKGQRESEPGSDSVTTALDKPRGLTAVNITDAEALLLWQPAIATVDGYVITYSADSVAPVMERVSGNVVEFEMSSLTPATHYTVKVYAVRDLAKSAATTTEFTTDVDAPQDLAASNIQTENCMLTWKPPRADITGYILSFESADRTVREVVLSPTAVSYNMAQLSASTEYSVKLQAIAGPKRSRVITTVFTT
ncbi:tenascin-like isoform X1, partial [Lates japonicus]